MLVAKNSEGKLELRKCQASLKFRFYLKYAGQDEFVTGESFDSKFDAVIASRDFALSAMCGIFQPSDLLVKSNLIDQETLVSLNWAYRKLQSGSEDDQLSAFYIKKLIDAVS